MPVLLVRYLSVKCDKGILAEFMVRGVFLHILKKFIFLWSISRQFRNIRWKWGRHLDHFNFFFFKIGGYTKQEIDYLKLFSLVQPPFLWMDFTIFMYYNSCTNSNRLPIQFILLILLFLASFHAKIPKFH